MSAARIVLVYALVAAAWIFASDIVTRELVVDPNLVTVVSIAKGVLFVVVTSALLFLQIRDDLARLQASGDRLRDSEQRFRSIVALSPMPMTVRDRGGNITLMNDAFVTLIGYAADEIRTLEDWLSAAYPDLAYRRQVLEEWDAESERSRRAGEAFVPVQVTIHCKDGTDRTMLLSSASLGLASSEQAVVYWDITERERAAADLRRSNLRLEQALRSVITLIGKVVEVRDPYTQGHEEGVARISRRIAEEMGLPPDEVNGIEVAGLVHDVGKLSVPAEILTKPGRLTDLEYELIKSHSQRGYDILNGIDFGWPVADVVLQHHERMDGSGYPAGLAGADISTAARVLMAADVVDAMRAHRPYRPALGLEAAMTEIAGHPEKFDPQVIAACVRLHEADRLEG